MWDKGASAKGGSKGMQGLQPRRIRKWLATWDSSTLAWGWTGWTFESEQATIPQGSFFLFLLAFTNTVLCLIHVHW
jgi:hypothetical protein